MYGISKDCKISVLYRNLHTRSTSGVVLCNLHMVLHAGDHFPASVSRGFENLSDTKMGEIASCHPLSSRYLLLVSYSMSGLSLACHLPPAIKAPGNGQKKRNNSEMSCAKTATSAVRPEWVGFSLRGRGGRRRKGTSRWARGLGRAGVERSSQAGAVVVAVVSIVDSARLSLP